MSALLWRKRWLWLLAGGFLFYSLCVPQTTFAHPGHTSGQKQILTQAVGAYEMRVIIEPPVSGSGPLFVEVQPQRPPFAAQVTVAVTQSNSVAREQRGVLLPLNAGAGSYVLQLAVDQPGFWNLYLKAEGRNGTGTALVPFRVMQDMPSVQTVSLLLALAGVGVLLSVSIAVVGYSSQRQRPPSRTTIWSLTHLFAVCVTITAVLGVQQVFSPPSLPAQQQKVSPYINLTVQVKSIDIHASKTTQLLLTLVDGSTGRPVEDIGVDHEALMHLVLIEQEGRDFAHVHPARVAPGQYLASFEPQYTGEYMLYAEVARQLGGAQLLEQPIYIAEASKRVGISQKKSMLSFPGMQTLGELRIQAQATPNVLQPHLPTLLTFQVFRQGRQIQQFEDWLGMKGHLLLRERKTGALSHLHALGAMQNTGSLQTTGRAGIEFLYTFPFPGEYDAWFQFKYNGDVQTLAFHLTIPALKAS